MWLIASFSCDLETNSSNTQVHSIEHEENKCGLYKRRATVIIPNEYDATETDDT